MEHFFHLASKLPKVVISAREELDLNMSADKYSSIVDSNIRKGKDVLNKFLSKVEVKISEISNS